MRIVGGSFGGRRFNPPAKIPARPTTELAKEGLFNMLSNMIDLEDLKTLEIFGGTGSISYELASRGAKDITIVERDPASIEFIKKTTSELGIAAQFKIIRSDVFKFLKLCTEQYDLIFADPPYALEQMDNLPNLVFEKAILLPEGIFILEHTHRNDFTNHHNYLRMKSYGETIFTFFTSKSN